MHAATRLSTRFQPSLSVLSEKKVRHEHGAIVNANEIRKASAVCVSISAKVEDSKCKSKQLVQLEAQRIVNAQRPKEIDGFEGDRSA